MGLELPTLANGRYRIEGRLGEGGMATVFRAYDTRLHVERAVKILSPDLAQHHQIRDRFETEASTMARLHHRNIVTVHDIGSDGNRVYMVMEMVRGGSLMDRIDDHGVLHPQMAITATIAMAAALGVAHKNKVIHRDVKPHNVLINEEGVAKMTDFGIARIEDGTSSQTRTGAVMGTMAYMAPEQRLSARRATNKSDLYAVAASFYVMLTKGNPFEIYDEDEQDHLFEGLSVEIVDFLKKGCHLDKDKRFADHTEMIAALEELREHVGSSSDDALPLFVPHREGGTERKELTEDQIDAIHTMWQTYSGQSQASASGYGSASGSASGSSDTVGFDMWDEEEGLDPFAMAGDAPQEDAANSIAEPPPSQAQVPEAAATPVQPTVFPQQSIPPQPEPPTQIQGSNGLLMGAIVALLILIVGIGGYSVMQKGEAPKEESETKKMLVELNRKLEQQAEEKRQADAAAKQEAQKLEAAKAAAVPPVDVAAAQAAPDGQQPAAQAAPDGQQPAAQAAAANNEQQTKTPEQLAKEKKRKEDREKRKRQDETAVQGPKGTIMVRGPGIKSAKIDGKSVACRGAFGCKGSFAPGKRRVVAYGKNARKSWSVKLKPGGSKRLCWNFVENTKCGG